MFVPNTMSQLLLVIIFVTWQSPSKIPESDSSYPKGGYYRTCMYGKSGERVTNMLPSHPAQGGTHGTGWGTLTNKHQTSVSQFTNLHQIKTSIIIKHTYIHTLYIRNSNHQHTQNLYELPWHVPVYLHPQFVFHIHRSKNPQKTATLQAVITGHLPFVSATAGGIMATPSSPSPCAPKENRQLSISEAIKKKPTEVTS